MRKAIALLLSLSGCSTLFLQEDGFGQRIPKECVDLESCEQLLQEARRRERSCEANTIGKVKCEDARSDTEQVHERWQRFHQARQRQERQEQEQKEQQAEAERRDRAEKLERERREEAQQQRAEAEGKRRQEEEEKSSRMRLLSAVSLWKVEQSRACRDAWATLGCKNAPEGATEEHAAACTADCARAAQDAATKAHDEALSACVQSYTGAAGRASPHCVLTVPASAEARYKDLPGLCKQRCQEQGKAKLAELAAERARKAAESKPAGGAPAGGSGGSGDRVKCCDGTLSPTCTYSRPSLRGCCSHHGGVC